MSFSPLLVTAGRASRLLRAMANERRLVILCHLSEREHSVNELCRLVGLSQSALSQHLAKLRRDRLVETRRSAQTVYYSVASPEVGRLLHALCDLFEPDGANTPAAPSDRARERPCRAETADERALWRKSDI